MESVNQKSLKIVDFPKITLPHSPVPGPKHWLILGVSLTHLVESRDLFLLEVQIAGF